MNYVEIRTNETNQNKYFNNSMDNNIVFIETLLDSDLKKLTNVTTQKLEEYKNFKKEKTPLLESRHFSGTQKERIKQSIGNKKWNCITNILKFFQSNGYGDLSKDMNGYLYKNFDNLSLMEPKSAESQINKFLSKKFTYHFNIKRANQYRLKITDGTKRVLKYNETFCSGVLSENELKSAVDTANGNKIPQEKIEKEKKNVEKKIVEKNIENEHEKLIQSVDNSRFENEKDVDDFINKQSKIKKYLLCAIDDIKEGIEKYDTVENDKEKEKIKNKK